jgi:KEOPS complex subunit Cgi121
MEVLEGIATVADVQAFVADLDAVAERHDVAVQAFDARYVAGREHLARAVACADRAIEHDDAIAREPSVEILLYAAGRRQIDRALTMGVDEGEGPVAIVVHAPPGGARAAAETRAVEDLRALLDEERPTLDAPDESLLADFVDVGPAEREVTDASLSALVSERVALLAVEK